MRESMDFEAISTLMLLARISLKENCLAQSEERNRKEGKAGLV
jgi:hypothetical protein